MKRIVTTILLGVALMAPTITQAENLSADQAREAGAYYMRSNTTMTRLTADQLTLLRQWNNDELGVPSMYLFSNGANAWIVMAATTAIHPVVCVSDESPIELDNMPPQLEAMLQQSNEWICYVQTVDAEMALPDDPMWTKMANNKLSVNTKAAAYLLTTKWDQGEAAGRTYNMLSPKIGDYYCYTGCVATALAQICKYYSYPTVGKSRITYTWYYTQNGVQKSKAITLNFADSAALDYSLMPASISTASPLARRYEISRLDYYVGVAMQMQFGTDDEGGGSGTTSNVVVDGMKKYLKYQEGSYVNRTTIRDTHFLNSVNRELELNRPLYMSGASSTGGDAHSAGHAWVCDGYRANDDTLYHMNWGWGGSGNTFYNLAANNMPIEGMDYNFNARRSGVYQSIIVGLIPPADSTDRDVYVGVRQVEDNTTLGKAYPNPATLEVMLPYSSDRATDLQVYSVDGRMVRSQRVEAGEGELTLRVSGMPAGIYIYRMGNAHGKFVVR